MSEQLKKKTISDVEKFVALVAGKQGWLLHPDKGFLEIIIEGLATNYNRYGYFACPCRDHCGNREKDADLICPCEYCIPDQEEFGHCYCGLYLTPEFGKRGEMPSSIPERRPEDKR